MKKYIVDFSEVSKEDIPLVGGKGANLGEMVQAKIPVPEGFIVTAKGYFHFLEDNKLTSRIESQLSGLDVSDSNQLSQRARQIQDEILKSPIPKDIEDEIVKAYRKLAGRKKLFVAVRSSATAEDLPTASFAGAQKTFLNVLGERDVVLSVRKAWASLFEARAIFYRVEKNFDHLSVGLAVPVQKMVQSDESGIMFTVDPVTSNKQRIVIEAIYGLGEMIVSGELTPDHYVLDKGDLTILDKIIISQTKQLVKVGNGNKLVSISKEWSKRQKISDEKILEIARIGKKLEEHYYFPQDIEWAVEGNKVYIVQTRPITTIQETKKEEVRVIISKDMKLLASGSPASPGIVSGPAKIIFSAKEISKVQKGDILVAPMTKPDYVPAMKKACAVVTDSGGRTSHAAIVSRELGIPAVVGTGNATKSIKTGTMITVDGGKGEVYLGSIKIVSKVVPFSSQRKLEKEVKTATKIYVNLGDPDRAEELAARNIDGVGLLRAEFMIANLGIHPKKLIAEGKKKIFIDNLALGLRKICKAFYPRPVIYRTTDFKTNEYRNLKGGEKFEPIEENPMLGFRGALRYVHNPDVFNLELEVVNEVREKDGLKNLNVMIPFVRTPDELFEVRKMIVKKGLTRSPSFKIFMMVEIPSNVILLDKFIKVGIDGLSIGSNDLTMLTLGVDRDNQDLAGSYNETDESVIKLMEQVIKTAHKYNVTTSICGQAPAFYPDLTRKLIELGITSISTDPDSIDSIRDLAYTIERDLVKNGKN
jgi:pyruvate,water dikinase